MFLSFLAIPICPFKWNYGYLVMHLTTNVVKNVIQLVTAGFVFISFLLNYENFRIHQGEGQSMSYLYEKCKGRLGIRTQKRSKIPQALGNWLLKK